MKLRIAPGQYPNDEQSPESTTALLVCTENFERLADSAPSIFVPGAQVEALHELAALAPACRMGAVRPVVECSGWDLDCAGK